MAETTVVRGVSGRIRIDTSDLARATAATTAFTKEFGGSMGGVSKQTATAEGDLKRLANTHASTVRPAHDATTSSVKRLEESMHHGSIAIGQYGEKWEGLSRRLGGVQGLLGGGLGLGLAGLAGAAGAGLVIEGVKGAIETAEESEKAFAALHQAADVSKQDFGELREGVESFIQTNRRFIGDQYEAVTAMGMFTRGGLDQETATRALGVALDLANLKGISLADAAHIVQLALNGNGRAVRELGIDLKTLTAEQDTSETASKNLEKAQNYAEAAAKRLAAAQRALVEFEDGLHAKKTRSQLDYDHEADKKKAVEDATKALAAAQADLTAATDATNNSTSKQLKVLDELATKTEGGRSSISHMRQAQNDLNKSQQDFAEKVGPTMAESLAQDIDWFNKAATAAFGYAKTISDIPGFPGGNVPVGAEKPAPGGGVPGHPGMTTETAHQLGLVTLAELEHGVAAQRSTEWTDRLSDSLIAETRAAQRQGEITSSVTSNLGAQRDESDNLTGRNAALQAAIYDVGVAHNSLVTRIHEVITAQRDESDQFSDTGANSRNQLRQTQTVYDGFVAHINSEHIDAAKIYVDYGDVLAARFQFDELIRNVAIHRGELQANFVVNRIGSQGNLEGLASGGTAIPGHIYRVGESGEETLVMGDRGGYVIPGASGRNRESAQPASVQVRIDQPVILDGREIGRIVDERVATVQAGTFR